MTGFLGRSDNMVKPQPETTGEFICRVGRSGSRDEMTVLVEVRAGAAEGVDLATRYRDLLRSRLGVEVHLGLGRR